jgi:trans-aconitate methyltransferase
MTDWDAHGYARRSALQRAMAAEVLAALELRGDERVLDVGCGDGRITAEVAARLPRGSAVGVDASPAMVAFAAARPEAARPNLRFLEADARRLPFADAFDLALSFNALHWVPEPADALLAIRRALRPNGRAALRLVPVSARESLEDVAESARRAPRWSPHLEGFAAPYRHLAPDAFAALAESCGFRVLRLQAEEKAWDFGSRDAFLAYLGITLVAWTHRLPEPDRPAFVADVLDRYAPIAGDDHTFRFAQMDLLLAADAPRQGP